MMKRRAAARRRRPPGVDKGAHPLMFIPALAACTAKRMKTAGFHTLRVLPPGSAARGKTRKTLAEMDAIHFCETKKAPHMGGCANAVRKRSLGAAKPPHCLFSFNYFLRPIAPAAATRAITA